MAKRILIHAEECTLDNLNLFLSITNDEDNWNDEEKMEFCRWNTDLLLYFDGYEWNWTNHKYEVADYDCLFSEFIEDNKKEI